ncbi:unnamed protein product [Amoebophrya sp. A120]|nr:unnamed protein product [Amoebophrya sp. A120]|eukprot:GSA120T00020529001.1
MGDTGGEVFTFILLLQLFVVFFNFRRKTLSVYLLQLLLHRKFLLLSAFLGRELALAFLLEFQFYVCLLTTLQVGSHSSVPPVKSPFPGLPASSPPNEKGLHSGDVDHLVSSDVHPASHRDRQTTPEVEDQRSSPIMKPTSKRAFACPGSSCPEDVPRAPKTTPEQKKLPDLTADEAAECGLLQQTVVDDDALLVREEDARQRRAGGDRRTSFSRSSHKDHRPVAVPRVDLQDRFSASLAAKLATSLLQDVEEKRTRDGPEDQRAGGLSCGSSCEEDGKRRKR